MAVFGFIILGLCAGTLSGLLGVGGGVIIIPALTSLFGMGIKQAIGTSLAVIVPTAISGAIVHYKAGNVNLQGFILIALGAIIGGILGAKIVSLIPAGVLKTIFAIFMIIAAVRMLISK